MAPLWRTLRSPKLALGTLSFLALYCAAATWNPWTRPGSARLPGWAEFLGLDRPFSSPLFLAGVFLLFVSTLACTADRTFRLSALSAGRVRPHGAPFPDRPGCSLEAFLRSEGFRGRGEVLYRFRFALWGGWLLHTGLLALIAGIAVQQAFHDGGAFELSEGEVLRLDDPSAIFGREHGPFASATPPPLEVGLITFNPFLRQRGYAPDRASVISVRRPGWPAVEATLDRASGADAGFVTVYQAIPSGLSLNLNIQGLGLRSLHLRSGGDRTMSGEFRSPEGMPVRFLLQCSRDCDDPDGPGPLRVLAEAQGERLELSPGSPFKFGRVPARLDSIVRWGGFTYSRSPGIPAVFSGFGLVLLGATLMSFPAGVALLASNGGETAGWVYVTRGREALLASWSTGTATVSNQQSGGS